MEKEAGFAGATSLSFLSLLDVHEHLNDLFLTHQEALLMLDVPLALERLVQFEKELREHMRFEDEVLLPIYRRAGRIIGGPVEFFTGEHKKMLEFIVQFKETLHQLEKKPADLRREIIELLDAESRFKQIVEHHDLRE